MPDPLSITIGVTCHVTSSIKALQVYRDLSAQFCAISVSVLSAKTQFDCIADALDRIQDTLLSRLRLAAQWTSSRELSGQTLQSTMAACESTFALITETLYRLTNESLETCGPGTTKVQFVQLWNTSDIKTALKQVSILIPALNIIHSALISEGKAEMMDILTNERSLTAFAKVACNANWDTRSTPTISNPSTPSTPEADHRSFDLDSYFANSNFYRNAWATAKKRNSSISISNQGTGRPEHRHLAKAMASFKAAPQHPDQLSFRRFDLLEVSKVQGPWWQAKKNSGETGRVPSNYLSLFDARLPMHNDVCTRVVKAAYPYVADPRKPEELSFEKDEVMEAYDMKPGWWYPKKKTGESGVVPALYFILDGEARIDRRRPLANLPSPPPCSQVPKKSRQATAISAVHAAVVEPPDMFSFLDHPPIAQAVWNAPDWIVEDEAMKIMK